MITNTGLNQLKEIIDYMDKVPYCVTPKTLYCPKQLYDGFDPCREQTYQTCYDGIVYHNYKASGVQNAPAYELLARGLHDNRMLAALNQFLDSHGRNATIGIMGGHALARTDATYRQIALLGKRLTEQGFVMLSGGGPGAMEATHLGAWMAGRSNQQLDQAIEMLSPSPTFNDEGWLSTAFDVISTFPQVSDYHSVGVPTWVYGHEPSTPFATHIAKFFDNSVREDSILTLAYGGLVYAPGSAGTMQEIFQEAVQNHYLSMGFASPMIFFGEHYWTQEMPVYPLLQQLMTTGRYKNLLLSITDDIDDIILTLNHFTPGHRPE